MLRLLPKWFKVVNRDDLFKYSSNGYFSSQSEDERHAAMPLLAFIYRLLSARPSLSNAALNAGLLDVLLNTRICNSQLFYASGVCDRERYIAFHTVLRSTLILLAGTGNSLERVLAHPIVIMWPELIEQTPAVHGFRMISLESQTWRLALWRGLGSNLVERRLHAIDDIFHAPSVYGVSDYMGMCIDLVEFSS